LATTVGFGFPKGKLIRKRNNYIIKQTKICFNHLNGDIQPAKSTHDILHRPITSLGCARIDTGLSASIKRVQKMKAKISQVTKDRKK